jgi:hypothetical protein
LADSLPVTGATIRACRALGRPPSPSWVDWAVQALEDGRDGSNLRILAGLREPFDYSDTVRYVDGALIEAGVEPLAQSEAISAYSQELVSFLVERSTIRPEALSQLANLCVDTGYPKSLMPFYLLHFARQDLLAGRDQHYWDGADSSNIDEIVQNEARAWLAARSRAA